MIRLAAVAAGMAFVTMIVFPQRAAAVYIDPLSGSLILQVLAAGVLAVTFSFKKGWARVRSALRNAWPWRSDR